MFRGSRLFISRSEMWFGTNSCGPSSMPISSIGRLRRPHESSLDRQSLAKSNARLSKTRTTHQARPGFAKDPPPSRAQRIAAKPRIRALRKTVHFCRLCCRASLPYFQWATAGTDEKLRDRAALFSHCDDAALDQSAKDLFAKLARSSRFRNHPGAARGDEALTCALQWRHG